MVPPHSHMTRLDSYQNYGLGIVIIILFKDFLLRAIESEQCSI